jgi:hypothetical protein
LNTPKTTRSPVSWQQMGNSELDPSSLTLPSITGPSTVVVAPAVPWSLGGRSMVCCWPARAQISSHLVPSQGVAWRLWSTRSKFGVLYIPGSSSSTRVTSSLLTPIVTAAWISLPHLWNIHIGGHIERVILTQTVSLFFSNGSVLGEHYI